MRTFLKLVHFEIHRFRFFLLGLMAITTLVQLGATWIYATHETNIRFDEIARFQSLMESGPTSLARVIAHHQQLLALPVMLCVISLVLYVFLIWYRDWFGRGTFIYRLLMLPSARRHLYTSKLSAIVLSIFVLLAWQMLLLVVMNGLFNIVVPAEFRIPSRMFDLIVANAAFETLLPVTLERFVLYYGMGIAALTVVFTAVLLERSYRRIGIVYALGYAGGWAIVQLMMFYAYESSLFDYLYKHEFAVLMVAGWLIMAAVSVSLGIRLLNKKITV